MRKFTLFILSFLCIVAVAQAQFIQVEKGSDVSRNYNSASVQKAASSLEALLERYHSLGNQSGNIRNYFTASEIKILKSYYNVSQNDLKNNAVSNQLHNLKSTSGNVTLREQSYINIGAASRLIQAPVTLSHNTGNTITLLNSVACQGGDNRFGRVFTLANYGVTDEFTITTGEIGVQEIDVATPLTVNIYNVSAGFPTGFPGNATLLGSTTVNIPANAGQSIVNYTFTTPVVVPAGTGSILVDVNQAFNGAAFFPGGTAADDGAPSYVLSTQCGVPNYVTTASIGFPDAHYYFTLTGDTASSGTFPAPYCGPLVYTADVEPITLVEVAGISNVSDAAINGSPDHEDFTAISGDMEEGMSYPIALEGNTGGNFTTSFTVFIDWNQDGILDNASERYEIGSITNSTGTDGQQATGTIVVPAGVTPGTTRMRVMKRFQAAFVPDSCTPGSGFGQAEDYSMNVTAGGFVGEPIAYCISNNAPAQFASFDPANPAVVTEIDGSPAPGFENAGAIDPNDSSVGYAIDNIGNFYSIDVATGSYTQIGTVVGDVVGAEFDTTTGVLYAITTTALYTLNTVAGTATLVGSLGFAAGEIPIALAIDGAGAAFLHEILTDSLYSVNLATGATTLIGATGFDANFGQGMGYDPVSGGIFMTAFNNSIFDSEYRSVNTATGATTLIAQMEPAELTQYGWVSFGETLPPPPCPEPTNLAVSNITETTVDLSWTAEPNATNGYVWSIFNSGDNPSSDPAVATGTTAAGVTTATATGLTNGLSYDFYVVADCNADGLSTLAGPVTFETLITPPECGGNFYDTGGISGPYENNANVTTVITPDNPGDAVMVTFTSFDVEANWDALYVYDGPDATFPQISSTNPATNTGFPPGGYWGSANPGPFTSSDPSGALTFVFRSDSSVILNGWEANVDCFTLPPPNDMIANSIDVDEIGFPYTDANVPMQAATVEAGNPSGCNLNGANGVWYNFVAEGSGTATASITTPAGASAVTFYTAPNENAVETDLALVVQNSNQCLPGTSASINTVAGQAYYVFVLNSGGATDIVIDGTNLGTNENSIEGFTFYPNPANTTINIKAVQNIDNVTLYSILGHKVLTQKINAISSEINISNLSTGTYIMKVASNGTIGTYKVIKM